VARNSCGLISAVLLACGFMIGAGVGDVVASQAKMVCENPRQEYAISFDEMTEIFFSGETQYHVLAVEKTKQRFVVVGLTGDGGPTFKAHFRPYKKMEFFVNNQLFQTDGCR